MTEPEPKDVRSLDETDLTLLALLQRDGRMPNKTLAELAGIAPSTTLARLRRLREIGALRGVHADVDPAALGRPIQAMIAVRLRPDSRNAMDSFAQTMSTVPGVLNVYFVSGSYDFMLHVAASGPDGLRSVIVEELNSRAVVASTETHLIFEHVRGNLSPAPRSRGAR